MMISSAALQCALLIQIISKTVSQFPMPYPFPGGPPQMTQGGPSEMMPMGPVPPLPQPFLPGGMGPMPVHFPMQQKMPMVVMPYYSKSADKHRKKNKKRKRPKKINFDDLSSESDDSSSTSDESSYRAKSRSGRRQVLTPVVSYVTKDGYVVYQKKIKKDKARDWLEMGKRARESDEMDDGEGDKEKLLRKLQKLKFTQKHRN